MHDPFGVDVTQRQDAVDQPVPDLLLGDLAAPSPGLSDHPVDVSAVRVLHDDVHFVFVYEVFVVLEDEGGVQDCEKGYFRVGLLSEVLV